MEHLGCPNHNTVRDENGAHQPCGFENRIYCGQCVTEGLGLADAESWDYERQPDNGLPERG